MNESIDEDYPVHYDFSNIKRQFQFGQKLQIINFDFLKKGTAAYSANEPLYFRINFKPSIDKCNLRVLLTLRNSGEVILGIFLSESFDATAFEQKTITGQADIGMLGKDDYSLGIEFVEINEGGNYYSLDNPGVNMKFQIVDDNAQKIKWENRFWGNIRFNDIRLLESDL